MIRMHCPQCGAQRVGAFRYCRGCGLDFDTLPDEGAGPSARSDVGLPVATALVGLKPAVRRRTLRGKWRYGAAGVAVLLAIGALSNLSDEPPTDPASDVAVASSTPRATATRTLEPAPTAPSRTPERTFGPSGPTRVGTVTKVVDGDTIRVEIDGTDYPVRYIGIDTPEPDAEDAQVRALAEAATAANAALVDGREVVLERDLSETDQFDRLLRYVWLDDGGEPVLVNRELVLQGFAQASSYPPDVKYDDIFVVAQAAAREGMLGLWAPTPTPPPTPSPTPTPVTVEDFDPISVDEDERTAFRGQRGDYSWQAVSFYAERVTVRWSATAARDANCRVAWELVPVSGDNVKSTIRVDARDEENGNRRIDTPFLDAALRVDSTCPSWLITMQGHAAAPVDQGGGGGGNCDSSYPDVCIPPYPPDLDCGDVPFDNFAVRGPDPHGFDGDNDGIGCEG